MKVKLVFAKEGSNGLVRDSFAEEVEVKLPEGFKHVRLESARCYDPNPQPNEPCGDTTATIWDFEDESRLVGKLLTYVDATYTDKEQREAHKSIMKDLVYGHCQELRARGAQIVNAVK